MVHRRPPSGRKPRLAERRCEGCRQPYRPYAPEQRICRACYRLQRETWRDGRARRARRADALYRRLVQSAGAVAQLADVYALPALTGWRRRDIDGALDDLVADGLLGEDAHGRLIVR